MAEKTKDENKKPSLKDMLKSCFEANPNLEKLHQTADGQCFAKKDDANTHAKTLESKIVKEHTREA